MSAETDFRALLAGYPPLTALVGSGIAQNGVPPNQQAPYVGFTVEHQLQHNLLGKVIDDTAVFTVTCWGSTASQADAVAEQVILALDSAPALNYVVVLSRGTAFDPELNLDATVLIVEWTVN